MVTINTLNTLIDDILLIIRNSNIGESENINKLQIKQWIDTYRALLIKQDIDKDGDINPDYIQTISVALDVAPLNPDATICKMVSSTKIPKAMDLNRRYGLLSITDSNGNTIQIGDENKAIRQRHRRFTCNDYIAYLKNGYLNIIGPNIIEDVYVDGVYENPDSVAEYNGDCIDNNSPYPLSYDKIPAIKDLILSKELGIAVRMITDTTNNSKNDMLDVGKST